MTHFKSVTWRDVRGLRFRSRESKSCPALSFLCCFCVFRPVSSPQVAGVQRFRFGPSDEVPQTSSSSQSDLGQLASQGGALLVPY